MPKNKAGDSSPVLDRSHMIAEAAYYKAAERGFAPGHELTDWLEAEADIAAMVAPAAQAKGKEKPAVVNAVSPRPRRPRSRANE
jgi:hypothetical protein